MMIVVQHIPGFCDGLMPERNDVSSKEEYEKLGYVQKWSSMPDFKFFREDTRFILAITNDAYYVVSICLTKPNWYPDWRA